MSQLGRRAAEVIKLATAAKATLATAESCTAGSLAVLLADAPGAAQQFHGGFVAYTKENKTAALGVPSSLIAAHTAVSSEVAKAMASGALARCPADVAVAITGVAGPEPDEDGNPVGQVYVSVATRWTNASEVVECNFGARPREEIRDLSLEFALKLMDTVLTRRQEEQGGSRRDPHANAS
jgi:nicotinamide-nucleotide amidase